MAKADQRFCLDGQRLVKTSGSWGTGTVVMRTEIDSFAKVTIGAWTGAVPTYFVVKTKAGQEMRYGEDAGARSHNSVSAPDPAIAWFVSKISDASQNTITFEYERDTSTPAGITSETRIKSIKYNGAEGPTDGASVTFNYLPRTDVSHYHAAGYRFVRSQHLLNITTTVNGTTVRTYKLGYGLLARTGALVVNSITECATKNAQEACLPSTTFKWNQSDIGLWADTQTISGDVNADDWGGLDWVRTGDFDGDGLTDIASIAPGGVHLKIAKPFGGFRGEYWDTPNNWPSSPEKLLVGDFNGDGRTDFAFPSGASIVVRYASQQYIFSEKIYTPTMPNGTPITWAGPGQIFVTEMNGDGRADIVNFHTQHEHPVLLLSTGDGFTSHAWQPNSFLNGDGRRDLLGDLNGDGITDFFSGYLEASQNSFVAVFFMSNGVGKPFTLTNVTQNLTASDHRQRWLADFDGDGLQEIGYISNEGSTSRLRILLPPGRGPAVPDRLLPAQITDAQKDWTWCFDYNGDGRADIVTRVGSTLRVNQTNATGFVLKTPSLGAMSFGQSYETYLGDFNGDGMIDIASRNGNSTISAVYSTRISGSSHDNVGYATGGTAQPDTIAEITSGDGARIKIDYRGLAQAPTGSTATDLGAATTYPDIVIAPPMWLVHEVWSSHGAGAPTEMRGTQYQYFNLHMNAEGRGVQGFEAESVRDLLTGDHEFTRFETKWPKSGMVQRKDSYLSDGTRTQSLVQTLAVSGNTATVPAFPYVGKSIETVYDEGDMTMTTTVTDQSPPDAYGNFTQINVTTSDALGRVSSSQNTTHTYDDADTANWILGRLNRSTVEHTASGSSILLGSHTATKVAKFYYYTSGPSLGLLKNEIVEPGFPGTSQNQTTTYTYDSYGHKATVKTSGFNRLNASLPARETSNGVSLTSSNELETTTTNAAGHVSKQRMSLLHGGVTWSQDPNGQQITIDYDAFGRKISQSQDEVSTTWTYELANGEVPNAVQKITANHSTGARTVVYQDLMGRPVRQSKLGLGGREIHEDTFYDAQGRVIEARRPAFANEVGASIITRYDARGRISEIESPGPGGSRITTRYAYDGLDTTITDPMGRSRTEQRNGVGKTEQIVDAGGGTLRYSYDATGNLVKTVDPIGQATWITYDVLGRKTSMLDPHMGEWKYAYNSFGELEWQKDAKGQETTLQYDVLGRMVSRTEPGDSQPSTWTYDTSAHGKGQLASVQGQQGYREDYAYDAKSRLSQVITSVTYQGTLQPFVTTTEYDGQNRVLKVTQPMGFVTENDYDDWGHLEALRSPPDPLQEVSDDDALNNRINEILGILPGYQSAAASKEAEAISAALAADEAQTEADLLEAQTLGNASAADQQYISQMRALANYYRPIAEQQRTLAAQYRAEEHRLDDYADFYLSLIELSYDNISHWQRLGQIRQEGLTEQANLFEASAIQAETAAQDAQAAVDGFEGNIDAREAQILAPVQQQIAQLLQQAQTAIAQAEIKRVESETAAANLARLQSQLAMLQQNQTDSGDYITWWRADQTDAEGRITQEVLGNGLLTRRDYDPATGHLLNIQTGGSIFTNNPSNNEGDVQDVGYTYDPMNNVTQRWDVNLGLTATYTYDPLDRLKTAQVLRPGIASLNTSTAWDYDAAGNFNYRTDAGTAKNYVYATQTLSSAGGQLSTQRKRLNAMDGLGNLSYDPNGNVLTSGNRSLTFNPANQPTFLTNGNDSVTYTYGPNRQRLTRYETKGAQTWNTLYLPGHERTRSTGSGNGNIWEYRHPLYVGDRLIGMRVRTLVAEVSTRRAEYYHHDALNSVDVVTDSNGMILKRYLYDPFGKRTDVTAIAGLIETGLVRTGTNYKFANMLPRGYTGHEHLDDLELIHMNGRVYDTRTARFVSADPHIQAPSDSQSYNRYSYVRNNPLKYTDPSGFFWGALSKLIKKFWRPLLAIAVSFIPGINILAAGFIAGLITSGGDLKAGIFGALTAGAFSAVGGYFAGVASKSVTGVLTTGERLLKIVAHGAVGGFSSVAQGGKFGSGFLSAGFTEAFAPGISGIKSTPGQAVAAAVIGGTASVLGGGKFGNGAVTGAFSYAFGSIANGVANGQSFGEAALDFAGKVWALPNTVIGLAYGGVGYAAGWVGYGLGLQANAPGISFGNNAIQFTNNPLTTTAITLGNVISYGTGQQFQPGTPRYGGAHKLGVEEMQHTYQAQALGPFYLPAHGALGIAAMIRDGYWHGPTNVLETGPHEPTPRPW
ncbi:MAG: FG-GAP-like repeat-containing protein [Panacagrimonas sp.]